MREVMRYLRPVPTMSSHVLAGAIMLVLLPARAVHGPDRFGCGQSGSRGSDDPLDAGRAEYLFGIFDRQMRSSLPLHTPCKPRPAAPACDNERADPPLLTVAAPVPRIFCMIVAFSARRAAIAFVWCCRVHIGASERVRRVICVCVLACRSCGVLVRGAVCIFLAHL